MLVTPLDAQQLHAGMYPLISPALFHFSLAVTPVTMIVYVELLLIQSLLVWKHYKKRWSDYEIIIFYNNCRRN